MSGLIIPTLYVISGCTLLTAFEHSQASKHFDSERKQTHRLFAMACYFLAAMIFCRAKAYDADSVDELIALRRWEIIFVIAGSAFLTWFLAAYTKFRPKVFLIGISLFWLGMIAINLGLPYGVQFADRPDQLSYVRLPWGETLVDLRVTSKSFWHILGSLSILLMFLFGFLAAFRLHLNERYSRGGRLALALLLYFLTVTVNQLSNWDFIEFIHISDFGIAALLLFMNYELTQQVRSENQRARELIDHLPIAVCLKDLKGRYIHVNKRFSDLFGVKIGTTDAVTDTDIFGPDLEKSIKDVDTAILSHGQDVEWEYSHDFQEKSAVFKLHQFPICKDSNLIALCNLHTDITEERKKDTKLAKLRLQLWRSDRLANTNSISKSIAHEICQPLSAILSNAQAGLRFLAQHPLDKEEIREIFEDIVRDERRAGAVVNSLRSMLQRREAQHSRTDLASMIHEIVEFLRTEMAQHSVALELQLEPDLFVWANKTQLQQVMLNLIMNAIEAMDTEEKEQRKLKIEAFRQENQLCVSIADSGCGIPPDSLDKIFEGFYTTKLNGLGVGLEICRAIMESHGGQIWVNNNAGKGATFSFCIPASLNANHARPVIDADDRASPN